MGYVSAERLPSLACPLIVNPSNGRRNFDQGIFLPPLPDINLNWDGCTFSHLHWTVLKAETVEQLSPEDWHLPIGLPHVVGAHEHCHICLSFTSFSMFRKMEVCNLYEIILNTFKKEFKRRQKKIRVPVIANQSGNELEKQWYNVVRLKEASDLVEEISAVRSSLYPLRNKHPIAHWLWQEDYKEAYEKTIYGYRVAYEVFDSMAGKIGEKSASAMIYNALETFNPDGAFCDLILEMLLRDQSDIDFIANLSFKQAYDFFRKLLEDIDKINLSYRVISRHKNMAIVLHEGVAEKYIEDKIPTITPNLYPEKWNQLGGLDSDEGFWLSVCHSKDSYLTLNFSQAVKNEKYAIQEVKYGNFAIVLEAIRQQLTKGIGLLCPFWKPSHPCCSSRNRAFLEKVWSGTCPNSNCKLWERLGCLATSRGVLDGNTKKHQGLNGSAALGG